MIFPILNGILSFRKATVTWILVALNVLVMAASDIYGLKPLESYQSILEDKDFIEIQGAIYKSYLNTRVDHQVKRELASLVEGEDQHGNQVLGVLAFRDQKFLDSQLYDGHFPDEVAFSFWKEKVNQLKRNQALSLSHLLGVSSSSHTPMTWLSYMFAHGSWGHLASNMIFLVLVGGTLELSLGGLGVLLVYLFSGFIGCAVYILFSGVSASPLVGASGAVSGLISIFAVLNWRQPVRFFYWLVIPQQKALGLVYLPGAFVFYLWITADLAGFLSSSSLMGGIAHGAHLGGHLAGFSAGLGLVILHKTLKTSPPDKFPVEMYKLYPFVSKTPQSRLL
ncbi:MAG: hypothetical protein CL676_12060 [Bdellovibrionaceae bacterium]|nr:hypothetical protein [Pseudobdellovibrionaceae bacterium]|tara:strand:+ start:4233 stop:5243 length:1011 start_codon:yes stop_codon:yes gene_type:complete